jgi:ABC-2 type transport system ATP-binding protein
MVRRALLGTALIHRPRFLLLDEPTAGIDPLLRIRIWEILRGLCDDGISILITTHHISEAIRCDRTVFLRNGGIIADGPPRELMAQYGVDDLEEAFVASVAAATGEEASRP